MEVITQQAVMAATRQWRFHVRPSGKGFYVGQPKQELCGTEDWSVRKSEELDSIDP